MSTSKKITLRPYQSKAVSDLWKWFEYNHEGNPCLVLPTGAGKSIIVAEICKQAIEMYSATRILKVTHTKEIVKQNAEKLLAVWPEAPLGVYSAGLNHRDIGQITFAGLQSIRNHVNEVGHTDLFIVDEAHMIPHKDEGTYRKLINDLRIINPKMIVIGLTASPWRLGHGLITDDPAIFKELIQPVTIEELQRWGYLSKLVSKTTKKGIDAEGVHKRGGEYIASELQKKVDTKDNNEQVVLEIIEKAGDRKHWCVFCTGVSHAEHVADIFNQYGVSAACVHGQLDNKERDRRIQAFKDGEYKALTNINILSIGFDFEDIDLIAMLRPTMSPSLYIQQAGRGLRVKSHTDHCIAKGQKVLTDKGLIPIEKVSKNMMVWDGCNWVKHCGIIFRGTREVITYAGLTATKDHKVWTDEGWKPFGICAEKQIKIRVTGIGRNEVREVSHYNREDSEKREYLETTNRNKMFRMRGCFGKRLHKRNKRACRLQKVRETKNISGMAYEKMHFSKTKMHKQKKQSLLQVWSKGHIFWLRLTNSNGSLYNKELRIRQVKANRQNRQQQRLRTRKFEIVNKRAKPLSHTKKTNITGNTLYKNVSQRNKIRRLNSKKTNIRRIYNRSNHKKTKENTSKAKIREVYDIRNAGPLHRFTVQGLLVSNCLVLDFAGVVEQHGPITDVATPRKPGEGIAPSKICPECDEIIHASLKVCPSCEFVFPPVQKDPLKLHDDDIMGTTDKTMDITGWSWSVQTAKSGIDMIRVTYYGALSDRPISEYLCLLHTGFAGYKAMESLKMIASKSNGEYMSCESLDEVAKTMERSIPPSEIVYKRDGKFFRVVDRIWGMKKIVEEDEKRIEENEKKIWF